MATTRRTVGAMVAAGAVALTGCGDGIASETAADAAAPPIIEEPATGGVAETEQTAGAGRDVTFTDHGVNPFHDPQEEPQSTFALDVDTGSYRVAQRWLAEGRLPPAAAVRTEEFVNAFDPAVEPPGDDDVFAVQVDGGPTPYVSGPDHRLVRVALQTPQLDPADRPDATLTFVIDVSGSMAEGGRLELAKQALTTMVDHLAPGDRVAIVVYGSDARRLLAPTPILERETIVDAIGALEPEGSTNASAGLQLGYGIALDAIQPGINRVVLVSDGVANVGDTSWNGILDRIRGAVDDGIELVTVGVGLDNYNDTLLEQLADNGDGFYAYVDTHDEAERLFADELTGTLLTVAHDAKAQVQWDPAGVVRYRLLGFENRALADEDFRRDEVDAGEVGAGHHVTALYEVQLRADADHLGTVRLRWAQPETGAVSELERPITVAALAPDWAETAPPFQLAATAAAFAEVLRDSEHAATVTLADVSQQAQRLADTLDDPAAVELATAVSRASEHVTPG